MEHWKRLEPLKPQEPWPWGVWDVEAENWWDLRMIGCYDGRKYWCFRGVTEFIQHLLRPEYRGWRWFAHYGGRYDLNFVWEWLRQKERGFKVSFICSGSNIIRMTFQHGRHKIHFCDSFRLLPAGLKRLTEAFGTKTQKWDRPDWGSVEYNRDDCIALYEVLEHFFREIDLQAETIASAALLYFRRNYLRRSIYQAPEPAQALARLAYQGGRCEVFARGGARRRYYDVNSMYPAAMCMPLPADYFGRTRSIVDDGETRLGVYHATVEVPECFYPPLPWWDRRQYFPVGRFEGWWCGVELIYAMTCGARVLKIHDGHVWRAEPWLEEYARDLYEKKRTATEPQRTIFKLLLNSLYGKFGQREEREVYVIDDGRSGLVPVPDVHGRETGIAIERKTCRSRHLLPQVAAHVTAWGRIRLHELVTEAEADYCDTDSVITSRNLPTGDDLGALKLEGEGSCRFYGPKLYRFGEKWKAKGVPDEGLAEAFADGREITYERNVSILEAIRWGLPATSRKTVTMRWRDPEPKRVWDWDHEKTWPWVVRDNRRLSAMVHSGKIL